MVRHLYGGATSDYTAEVDARGYQRRVGGVVLDVRRHDTGATVTDLVAPPDWDGVAFPAGKAISDRDGDVRFLGPDDLTARLEVRTAAVAGRRAGDWWLLDGQPPPVVGGADVDGLRETLMQYVREQIADAALGDVDTTGFVKQAELTAAIDRALESLPPVPDVTGLVDEADARSIADAAAAAALAAYQPPTPDLTGYALLSDVAALQSALAGALMRIENLENGTTPTDPPPDAYSDTYSDVY